MNKIVYKFIIILSITGIILPNFVFAKDATQLPKMPETFDEVWAFLKRIIEPLPNALKGVWQEAMGIWQRMADWFKNLWDSNIWPKIESLWQKILAIFGREIEKRKETIQEELEKEKQEVKQELKEGAEKASKSLWQRIKDIIPGI
jgi:hypothetical protein